MKGFTIIEVVLVLAIAGLIFLMVFIALPALQRNQRDTQRRDDMSRFMSQVSQYQANNSGKIPAAGQIATFLTKYLSIAQRANGQIVNNPADNDEFVDPDGIGYGLQITAGAAGAIPAAVRNLQAPDYIIHMYTGVACGDNETLVANAGSRNYAIVYRLEGAGVYCGDNN